MVPALRRGNGAAPVVSIETLGGRGEPTIVWRSGEQAGIRVTVEYREATPDPVVGIMVRTRIGFEVYGTNTEAEGVRIGPCQTGDRIEVTFSFPCELCAQDYTVTAASHDPDGVAHDWLDDAVAVTVTDNRYTAGVANLRAKVAVARAVEQPVP
jgi:lipopolysaccharide transport system ATP-binding protein